MNQILLAAIMCLIASNAFAACRQALVFALDVSSSVDRQEYSLQMQGLAGALLDPEVQSLLLSQPSAPVSLSAFEWSGRFDQRVIFDWQNIESPEDLLRIAAILHAQSRPETTRPTAIGHALQFAGQSLSKVSSCWQLTVDISGDGKSNDGFRPRLGKSASIFDRVIVNGLVIANDAPSPDRVVESEIGELTSYFHHAVIHGPGAFIETALGFQDFEAAMKRKLLRELSIAVANADQP